MMTKSELVEKMATDASISKSAARAFVASLSRDRRHQVNRIRHSALGPECRPVLSRSMTAGHAHRPCRRCAAPIKVIDGAAH